MILSHLSWAIIFCSPRLISELNLCLAQVRATRCTDILKHGASPGSLLVDEADMMRPHSTLLFLRHGISALMTGHISSDRLLVASHLRRISTNQAREACDKRHVTTVTDGYSTRLHQLLQSPLHPQRRASE